VSLWATRNYPKYASAVCRPAGTGTDQVRTGDQIETAKALSLTIPTLARADEVRE